MKNDGSKNEDADVLVTGATGLIGRWLLAALTARGRSVVAVVRNASQREAELRAFVAALGGDASRLVVVSGDVESASLGLEDRWDGVRDVYHLAARFEFGMTAAEARRANVEGTLHALEWAHARPALRRFVFLGGYRMTRPTPALQEMAKDANAAPGNGAGLSLPWAARGDGTARRLYREHGAYEASKHESALAFRHFVRTHDLPWTAVHPSTVIGDSRTGATTQRVGLGETIERLWEGRLPALIGNARTFVPVVPVDYLASFLATVPERDETRGQELTVLDPSTPTLPDLVRSVAGHLHVDAPRHALPVALVRALPQALTGVEKETLGFLSEDRYDVSLADEHARAVDLARPALGTSIDRWCDHLVSTRFGADPAADRGALRDGVFAVGDPSSADIVYLHGLPWNGDAWKPVAERVGRPHARLDLPGLGRSAPRPRKEEMDDDLGWLDRALGARASKVLLVGHSIGAGLAVRYAHAHPEKVRGVVLVSPAFLQRPASPMLRVSPIVARTLRCSTPAELSLRLLPERDRAAEVLPAVVSASIDLRRGGVAARIARALARASRPEVRADLLRRVTELQCPVVLVHGESDPLVVAHPIEAVRTIAGAGHAPHLTRSGELASIVRAAAA